MKIPAELASTLAAVVDEGTLDGAAGRLRITPSAVSQRLRALERSVGRVLLVRSRPVRVTSAGAAVVRFARQCALLEHDAMVGIGEQTATPSVALAVNADSLATWFLPALARVSAERPVTFDLHRDDQDRTAELLAAGVVMAAVTSRARAVAGCRVTPLGAMRYEAVATPSFVERWAAAGYADAPVVVFDRHDALQDGWLRAGGADPSSVPRHHVPSSHDFAAAVLLGLGWGMLPLLQSEQALADGRLVRLGGEPEDVRLHWQQWDLQSDLLDTVAREVTAAARRGLSRR